MRDTALYRALNAHLPGVEAPLPGHPVYRALGFVPYDERTPAAFPGEYRGEAIATQYPETT